MCGENACLSRGFIESDGSSPRVRGKRHDLARTARDRGLIPACAGKTDQGGDDLPESRAHPRVCGENYIGFNAPSPKPGSSPRVRGKPAATTGLAFDTGLIPACAGKTKKQRKPLLSCRAHPRVCGENLVLFG